MQRLILCDVNQTLVSLKGGSAEALNSVFEAVYGIPNALRGITFAGSLVLPILNETYRKWRLVPLCENVTPDLSEIKPVYFEHLVRLLETWPECGICPGVRALLEALT